MSLVVLPRHVKESSLDDLVWSLLMFQEHVQYHVKCFKVVRTLSRLLTMLLDATNKHAQQLAHQDSRLELPW